MNKYIGFDIDSKKQLLCSRSWEKDRFATIGPDSGSMSKF